MKKFWKNLNELRKKNIISNKINSLFLIKKIVKLTVLVWKEPKFNGFTNLLYIKTDKLAITRTEKRGIFVEVKKSQKKILCTFYTLAAYFLSHLLSLSLVYTCPYP